MLTGGLSTSSWETIENLLGNVSKPGRYTGGEYNIQTKDWDQADIRVALAFPDIYEIGLSHMGLRILYELINDHPKMLAERVYAPWPDFQALLRSKNALLMSLENKRDLNEFDVVGFSLQYELSYTNVLTMLKLGGIPIYTSERAEHDPLVIGGGPCVFNPEPLADFFDFFLIGEAEEILPEILEQIRKWKLTGQTKAELLRQLEKNSGVYVPAHFQVSYEPDGRIQRIAPLTGAQPERAVVRDYSGAFFPKRWLVPYLDIVHDRVAYEIQRGCTKGCRFCQAGMIYRPVRERPAAAILESLKGLLSTTGYEELSLTSLSSADYSRIEELLTEACGCFTPQGINVSLPSLRIDSFSIDLAKRFQSNRKGSLTFAPEAGTERLRRVINKGVTRENLVTASHAAFKAGWQKLKLYFMIGLPTETQEDLEGIADLAFEVLKIGRQYHPKGNALRITVSVSTFVPKANTPFQWREQISIAETIRKQQFLQERIRGRQLELNWHDPLMSHLEGILTRGDRRLAKVIETAWLKGAQFDGWSDQFQFELWMDAFRQEGIDPSFYIRGRNYDEVLPWSHLNTGLSKDFLRLENERANQEVLTSDCRTDSCTSCGVCSTLHVSKKIEGN